MDDILSIFRNRSEKYIDDLDSLYAYLVEPFICFQEQEQKSDEKREDICPLPTYYKYESYDTKNESTTS